MTAVASSSRTAVDVSVDITELLSLAVRGLVPMFASERLLYCHRLKKEGQALTPEGLSPRYTLITLLGLHEFEKAGGQSPVVVNQVLASLLKNTDWITNIGDLGLLLWVHSVVLPNQAPGWCSSEDVERALDHFSDARECRTMELAWLLTGLAHNLLTQQGAVSGFADLAMRTYRKLEQNQGRSGCFGHLGRRATLGGLLRARIGSFADQVYPIYAMTRLAQACDLREPLDRAVDCAQAICRVQGSFGEWWWHYDSAGGRVVRRYPVFSVHQDGMAPMALFAVGEASGHDFGAPIHRGLQWIAGNNELGEDLRDTPTGVIWRSIFPTRKHTMYLDDVLAIAGFSVSTRVSVPCSILFECRPYHLGWLLYAFAPMSRRRFTVRSGTQQAHLRARS